MWKLWLFQRYILLDYKKIKCPHKRFAIVWAIVLILFNSRKSDVVAMLLWYRCRPTLYVLVYDHVHIIQDIRLSHVLKIPWFTVPNKKWPGVLCILVLHMLTILERKCQNDIVHINVTSQMYVFSTIRPRVIKMKYMTWNSWTIHFQWYIICHWEEKTEKCLNNTNKKISNYV